MTPLIQELKEKAEKCSYDSKQGWMEYGEIAQPSTILKLIKSLEIAEGSLKSFSKIKILLKIRNETREQFLEGIVNVAIEALEQIKKELSNES